MADTSDQDTSSPNAVVGALPMTAFPWDEIPDDYLSYAPDRPGHGHSLCVIHPPFAALMKATPESMLQAVILPALSNASRVAMGREQEYVIDGASTPDGLFLLFIHEAV